MVMAFSDRRPRKRDETAHVYAVGPLAEYPFTRALQAFSALAGQSENDAGLELDSQFLAPTQYLRILLDGCPLMDVRLDAVIGAFHTRQDFDQTALGHLTQIVQAALMRDNICAEKAAPDQFIFPETRHDRLCTRLVDGQDVVIEHSCRMPALDDLPELRFHSFNRQLCSM